MAAVGGKNISGIEKKVSDAFDLFDSSKNDSVDVREVGTIIRSLGLNPSEIQLRELIKKMEEEEPTGFIMKYKFVPVVTKAITENEFPRDSYDAIAVAFQALDPQGQGWINVDDLKQLLMAQGERFSEEEMDSMLRAGGDTASMQFHYEEYAKMLAENR